MKPGPKPRGQVKCKWSNSFAYAIGLLVADGCLLADGRHIDFTSKDRKQVELFRRCLKLKVKIGTKRSGVGNTYWRVQFGDVLFYRFLNSIGLFSAKSKTIKAVVVPDRYFSHFLRGYFDGDGTTYSFYDSLFPNSYRFYLAFASASPTFVSWLRERITGVLGVSGHVSHAPHKEYLQLKYAKREAQVVCRYMYNKKGNIFLQRKYLKIQRTLRIIKQRRGGEIGKHASFRS